MKEILNIIQGMKTSRVSNYVLAGLDSYTLNNGIIRLFENSRTHQDQITPHSHRFDFTCLVLKGHVINRVWVACPEVFGDFFQSSTITYKGVIGEHDLKAKGRGYWVFKDYTYDEGQCYSMKSEQVHSITFSKGAVVLFFEGPKKSDESMIIEPVVNDQVIKTYTNREYMFLKDAE